MRSNKNLKVFLIILGIFFIISTINNNYFSNSNHKISCNNRISEVKTNKNLQTAGFWIEGGGVVIDDSGAVGVTWLQFNESKNYCNGKGTWSDPYVIENVTFDALLYGPPGYAWCISIKNSKVPFIIKNCTIKNSNSVGMELFNVSNSQIINNTIINNGHSGIFARESNNNTIVDNHIRYNGFAYLKSAGILFSLSNFPISYCCYNNISGNTIYNNSNGIAIRAGGEIDDLTLYCHNNSISENNVTKNRGYGIYVTIFGGENDAFNNRIYTSNNSITNNNVTMNCLGEPYESCGIGYELIGEENTIIYSNFTTITGNIINGNKNDGLLVNIEGEDISIIKANNITISGNIISENSHSFYYDDEWYGGNGVIFAANEDDNADVEAKYNDIVGNIVKNNSENGILLYGDGNSHNLISANNVTENLVGIIIGESNYNKILGNNASFNSYVGIGLVYSDYNLVSANNVTNNTNGIYLIYSDYNNVTWNTLWGNEVCIIDEYCTGNIYENNGICEVKYIRAFVDDDDDDDDDDDKDSEFPLIILILLIGGTILGIIVLTTIILLFKKK